MHTSLRYWFSSAEYMRQISQETYIYLKTGTESFRSGNKSLKSYYKQMFSVWVRKKNIILSVGIMINISVLIEYINTDGNWNFNLPVRDVTFKFVALFLAWFCWSQVVLAAAKFYGVIGSNPVARNSFNSLGFFTQRFPVVIHDNTAKSCSTRLIMTDDVIAGSSN